MPLVISIARRYDHCGEPLEDLVQVGAIGLLQAIDRFDPKRGAQLSSFAIPTIEGEIRRELRDRGGTIRLPRSVQEARASVLGERDQLAARLGRDPTDQELGAAVGLSAEAVASALRAGSAAAPATLGNGASGTETERGTVDGELVASEDRVLLAEGFAALDERERRVLHLRYFGGLSQTQIAKQVGLSQAHISRIIRDALAKLRDQLAERPPKAPDSGAISPQSAAVSAVKPATADQHLASPPVRAYHRTHGIAGCSDTERVRRSALPPHDRARSRRAGRTRRGSRRWRSSTGAWRAAARRRMRPPTSARRSKRGSHSRSPAARRSRCPASRPRTAAGCCCGWRRRSHADLARAAEREDVSLNQFVSTALAGAVGWRGGSRPTTRRRRLRSPPAAGRPRSS